MLQGTALNTVGLLRTILGQGQVRFYLATVDRFPDWNVALEEQQYGRP